ncbi:MAG: hypothetical protein AB8B66_02955 [Rickettsiaceae bacterium]
MKKQFKKWKGGAKKHGGFGKSMTAQVHEWTSPKEENKENTTSLAGLGLVLDDIFGTGEEARIKAEGDEIARAEAEARVRAEGDEIARAEAEARIRAEEEGVAGAEQDQIDDIAELLQTRDIDDYLVYPVINTSSRLIAELKGGSDQAINEALDQGLDIAGDV